MLRNVETYLSVLDLEKRYWRAFTNLSLHWRNIDIPRKIYMYLREDLYISHTYSGQHLTKLGFKHSFLRSHNFKKKKL